MSHSVIIIGGGASGIVAAIAAARQGAKVTLLERNPQVGKKLLATGNGRCNFSNADLGVSHYHGGDPAFAAMVLQQFGLQETLAFFRSLGMQVCCEEGRFYPRSQQGSALLALLLQELRRLGVEVLTECLVGDVAYGASGWRVTAEHRGADLVLQSSALIVASGGQAGSQFGSDGAAFSWLRRLGLPLVTTLPALVPLCVELPGFTQLYGVRCPECRLSLWVDGEEVDERRGEIHWSKTALSGIPVLDLSGLAARALAEQRQVTLQLDLLPEMSSKELLSWLQPLSLLAPEEQVVRLSGLVREALSRLLLHMVREKGKAGKAKQLDLRQLAALLKQWRLPVSGTLDYREAQTTSGGVATEVLDSRSMAVRSCAGLYLTGELVDIHGDCGGYNLQWAWSSGYLAGKHAANT